jgi:hypothetical protein
MWGGVAEYRQAVSTYAPSSVVRFGSRLCKNSVGGIFGAIICRTPRPARPDKQSVTAQRRLSGEILR